MSLRDLRWDLLQRLLHLEAALIWRGRINTSDLTGTFGISRVQASRDIAKYQELAGSNLVYNRNTKSYHAADSFQPLFGERTGNHLLETARMSALPGTALRLPGQQVEVLPPMNRVVPLETVRLINLAINEKLRIEFSYQSIASPEQKLLVDAHHLVHAVGRWHLRGFSQMHGEYRDFVLARVVGVVKIVGPWIKDPSDDVAWNAVDQVLVRPHPSLNDAQTEIVAREFGLPVTGAHIALRRALRFYFEHDFRQLGDNRSLLEFVYPESAR